MPTGIRWDSSNQPRPPIRAGLRSFFGTVTRQFDTRTEAQKLAPVGSEPTGGGLSVLSAVQAPARPHAATDPFQPLNPPPVEEPDTIDALYETYIQKPVDLALWFRDFAVGKIDVHQPGKPEEIITEEGLKKLLGEAVKRPFKVINNSLGHSLDPAGTSEPAATLKPINPALLSPSFFQRFSDSALAKLIVLGTFTQNQSALNISARILALNEARRRGLIIGGANLGIINPAGGPAAWLRGLINSAQGINYDAEGNAIQQPGGSVDP